MREHTEQIRPPRALWVPFELGRPLGVPGDRAFQGRVLRAALALAEQPTGPILADFPEDAPASGGDDETWSCALPLPAAPTAETPLDSATWRLQRELQLLNPWHEEALRAGRRTTVGPSGLSPERMGEAARVLACAASGAPIEAPLGASAELPYLLRLLADDLKAFYTEAALAQPNSPAPSSPQLGKWIFHETELGQTLYDARDRWLKSEDPREQGVARQLVPGIWSRRP